jgi:hypothetical protein
VPTTSTSGAYPSLPCVGFALSVRARAERSGAAHHDRRVDGVFRTDGRAATTCGTGRWRRWPPTCGRPPPASANPSSRSAVGPPTNTASPSQAWLHPERELSGSDHLVACTTQPSATTCRSGRLRLRRCPSFRRAIRAVIRCGDRQPRTGRSSRRRRLRWRDSRAPAAESGAISSVSGRLRESAERSSVSPQTFGSDMARSPRIGDRPASRHARNPSCSTRTFGPTQLTRRCTHLRVKEVIR